MGLKNEIECFQAARFGAQSQQLLIFELKINKSFITQFATAYLFQSLQIRRCNTPNTSDFDIFVVMSNEIPHCDNAALFHIGIAGFKR